MGHHRIISVAVGHIMSVSSLFPSSRASLFAIQFLCIFRYGFPICNCVGIGMENGMVVLCTDTKEANRTTKKIERMIKIEAYLKYLKHE